MNKLHEIIEQVKGNSNTVYTSKEISHLFEKENKVFIEFILYFESKELKLPFEKLKKKKNKILIETYITKENINLIFSKPNKILLKNDKEDIDEINLENYSMEFSIKAKDLNKYKIKYKFLLEKKNEI